MRNCSCLVLNYRLQLVKEWKHKWKRYAVGKATVFLIGLLEFCACSSNTTVISVIPFSATICCWVSVNF